MSILLAWFLVSSLMIFPHSVSYFNELAGGPRNGHKYLLDSNIDWGQDLIALRRWMEEHPDARPMMLAYFGGVPPELAYEDMIRAPLGEHDVTFPEPLVGPVPGWHAVSINCLYGYPRFPPTTGSDAGYKYYRRFQPVDTAGFSIYIYHLERPEVDRVRAAMGLPPIADQ